MNEEILLNSCHMCPPTHRTGSSRSKPVGSTRGRQRVGPAAAGRRLQPLLWHQPSDSCSAVFFHSLKVFLQCYKMYLFAIFSGICFLPTTPIPLCPTCHCLPTTHSVTFRFLSRYPNESNSGNFLPLKAFQY